MRLAIHNATATNTLIDSLSMSLWVQLPLELLLNIIDQTTDLETLGNWCQATQGNHQIHEIAMKARWKTATIDDRDLLSAPGNDTIRLNRIQRKLRKYNLGQSWRPIGEMVYTLLNMSKSDRCPANYVRHIVFDFRMLRYWNDNIQELASSAHDLMPSLESARYTLSKFEGHFHSLRSVICYGDTPQEILELVASKASAVQSIELRSLGAYGQLQIKLKDYPPRAQYALPRWPLQIKAISMLNQLRSLDIHGLSNHETTGLLDLLPNLVKLHYLTIACEVKEHNEFYGGCPIKSLFDKIVEASRTLESSAWLPPNLKSLSLIDMDRHSKSLALPPIQLPMLENHITHLHLDVANDNVGLIQSLVDCLSEKAFQVLSIPAYSDSGYQSGRSVHAYISHAISKHQDQLEKIRLVRAWNADHRWIEDINNAWSGMYAVQELVLGTRNPAWYSGFVDQWRKWVPKPTLSHYLCGFNEADTSSGRWGHCLRRIRIDHILIPELDVSILSESFYKNVKILMLQPATRDSGVTHDRPNCEAISAVTCDELALRILAHLLSSLSVIVIAAHWYWVGRDSMNSKPDGSLWRWADAKRNPTQAKLMSTLLLETDLNFLECSAVPFWHERDSIEWHQNLSSYSRTIPYNPSIEMFHQWNYFTMLPLDRACSIH